MPRIAFYGDDFTGSVDALLQLSRAGLDGVLLTNADVALPDDEAYDVVGIAGIARSLATPAMAAEVVPALTRLRDLGPEIVQYKACSTADSSPEIGSLGHVLELARDLFPPAPVPVVLAQPDFGRYTVFGHHFAHDGDRVYRLDRQPSMRNHPVTPATESDLRLHLGSQTSLDIGAMHWPSLADPTRLAALLNEASESAVICDALTDEHLDRIAEAILADRRRPRFVLGAGGLSGALGRTVQNVRPPLSTEATPAAGPTLVLNGSRSARTRQQIDAAARAGWTVVDLFEPAVLERATKLHAAGTDVVVDSAASGQSVSHTVETKLAEVADACLRQDARTRLVVSGGDTSGNVLRSLGVEQLRIVSQPWGNVALCHGTGRDVELVLKGGQMGHLGLFDDIKHGRRYAPTTA